MKYLLLAILCIELYTNCEGRPQDDNQGVSLASRKISFKNKIDPSIFNKMHNKTTTYLNKFLSVYDELKQFTDFLENMIENLKTDLKKLSERMDDKDAPISESVSNNQAQEDTNKILPTANQKPDENKEKQTTEKVLTNASASSEDSDYKDSDDDYD